MFWLLITLYEISEMLNAENFVGYILTRKV
jgi:hypothetical protein